MENLRMHPDLGVECIRAQANASMPVSYRRLTSTELSYADFTPTPRSSYGLLWYTLCYRKDNKKLRCRRDNARCVKRSFRVT